MVRTPLAALLSGILAAAALPAHADIAVTITPERASLGKRDDVVVHVTLTNTGAALERIARGRTPFGPVEGALFEITRDGQPVRYLGREVKRAAPREADMLLLAPGESRSARVELSRSYDMAATGSYAVRYRGAAAGVSLRTGGPGSSLSSNTAALFIEGRLPRGTSMPLLAAPEGAAPSYANCSNAQQDTIAGALAAGAAMAADGLAYLASGKQPGQRYVNWFGTPDAGRQAIVGKHFAAIKEAFGSRPVMVDCACDEDYFAYVYPARPYRIWVCNAFWTAPPTGTDSQGGTLLHEMSHFDVVAGTDDHVYGQQGAADMARTAPERAVNNADSHEYFGENSPPLN